ncbi:ornithine aminotransferase, mitochondrial [Cimex lectularius]|uniref:Ornithine aminotransferase n=1 Tax=Cimex lectularius TaxID=79782 RepID=A0A8I6R863_CIMLE|nr:ornithine aminotransferase, mitochondrial [Cimex lectularius]
MAAFKKSYVLLRTLQKNGTPNLKTSFVSRRTQSCDRYMALEKKHCANIYDSMKVVICRGQGTKVWDVDGNEYLDFLAGYAAVNTGHCHPKILQCLREQAGTLTHTSRAVYNSELPQFAEYITRYFNYDKVIPMNTGVEGGDTAIKIARRWGYLTKGIPENQAIVVMVTSNFWGRSLAALSSSTNPAVYEHFGPFMPGFGLVPFNNIEALEEAFCNPNVCAFMVEPILGEGGVVVPCDRYLAQVRSLCTEKNVLWIADEVQTGLGRTGQLLAVDHDCVRPDILILGKGLAGGFLPMSAVLANDDVMCHMTPGVHGSTFGGNPLASKVAVKTLEVIQEECLAENAKKMGERFREDLVCKVPKDVVTQIRGRGLMNAISVNTECGKASEFTARMRALGLMAKANDDVTIRLTPPLTITEEEICKAVDIIAEVVHSMKKN